MVTWGCSAALSFIVSRCSIRTVSGGFRLIRSSPAGPWKRSEDMRMSRRGWGGAKEGVARVAIFVHSFIYKESVSSSPTKQKERIDNQRHMGLRFGASHVRWHRTCCLFPSLCVVIIGSRSGSNYTEMKKKNCFVGIFPSNCTRLGGG